MRRVRPLATWLADVTSLTPDVTDRLAAAAPSIAVIGDLILDGWWHGHSDRLSREAPAPVVEVSQRNYAPGGAANTAVNLVALGARVRLVGLVGDDEAGERLIGLLANAGVDVTGVIRSTSVRTASKLRIVSDEQVLVRVDDVPTGPPPAVDQDRLAVAAEVASAGADAEIVCDYGFEMLDGAVRRAIAAADRDRPALTVVDAHDPITWAPVQPHLVTPNAREAARLFGLEGLPGPDRSAFVADRADELRWLAGADSVIVTLDRDGTVLLEGGSEPHRTRARPALETRTSGAGDTFVAALTVARACGLTLPLSVDAAQLAADVVVQRYGTSVCTLTDLAEQLGAPARLALDHDQLDRQLAEHRRAGHRIVFTNGCFDVLHRGHTTYLSQAARLGDVLVVAINGDDSVRRLKGPDRPVNASGDRAEVLAALGCVDYVTVFDTDTPIPLLERFRPDVYVKGGDYTAGMLEESPVVAAYGGEVRMLGYVPAQSTSAVVERIRSTAPGAARPDADPAPASPAAQE
jgi:D-beta-D-heptose 7-phosphate kinase/D-beta-D-heptose 1-phosphate adenosyltransferase